jgi:regulator of vacuolar morphogenesis
VIQNNNLLSKPPTSTHLYNSQSIENKTMAPPLELSIPSTILSTTDSSKPYTLYNITLRLPLRTFVVQKRYSDFVTLHQSLTSVVSSPPPAPLPAKSWFKSTASSPELTEERRKGLEAYLRTIAENPDRRWRETSAWRSFLNLPSTGASSASSARKELVEANQRLGIGSNAGQVASDPGIWLDLQREMKGQLHDARLFLGRRDAATTAQGQYEAGANAKRCLVKAAGLIGNLEEGLKILSEGEKRGEGGRVGAGELRRRRDLLGSAKVEREGLEKLAVNLAVKNQNVKGEGNGGAAATAQDKNALFGPGVSRPSGRVLGAPVPETDKTRELDNEGVVQLQKQMMQDQDLDVEELGKIVRRQREMGLVIHGELELQNEMLKRVDEDVDRVGRKIDIAKKRVNKIS